MNINLDKYYDAHKPTITIFGKPYEVENDHKKVLAFFKGRSGLKDDEDDIKQVLANGLVGGEKAAEEILTKKLPFSFLMKIIEGLTGCMTDKSIEELEAAEKASFHLK